MLRYTPSFPAILMTGVSLFAALAVGVRAQVEDFDISSQIGPDPVLPEPVYVDLWPGMNVGEVVGWTDGQTPEVAEGLKITAYATELVNPRTVHTLPNGDVLVIQSRAPGGKPKYRPKDYVRGWIMAAAAGGGSGPKPESNLITLLQDTDRDGVVDARHDLLTGLNSPFGVAWIDDTLYVALADGVVSYPYALGETAITSGPELVTLLPGGPLNHHWTKDLALSPDGTMLYASVGSNSNVGENGMEAEKGRAAIWQIDRTTGASKLFATGLRNPNGLTFHPETGELWAVINERDELGPNLVPDYMTSVRENGFYGWPYSYYGQHVDERVQPQRPDLVKAAIPPDYALSSHVAALGLVFTNGSAMPEAYANGAFVGQRGSWNREVFNGYRVSYVPFRNGKPDGMAQAVVTGFLSSEEEKVFGRPVGLGIDGTGALLIADDAGNTVWRVAAADGRVTEAPVETDRVATAGAGEAAASTEGAAPAEGAVPAEPAAPEDGTAPADPAAPTTEPAPAP
jgi:glucose/arabinose dehydrogenase